MLHLRYFRKICEIIRNAVCCAPFLPPWGHPAHVLLLMILMQKELLLPFPILPDEVIWGAWAWLEIAITKFCHLRTATTILLLIYIDTILSHKVDIRRVLDRVFFFILALIAVFNHETELKSRTVLSLREHSDITAEILADNLAEGEA